MGISDGIGFSILSPLGQTESLDNFVRTFYCKIENSIYAIITAAMAAKLAQQFQFEKVLKSTVQIRGFGSKNMYQ